MSESKFHTTKDGRRVRKGLYYYMNRAKKRGTSKPGKGTVTDKALRDSAKTAKKKMMGGAKEKMMYKKGGKSEFGMLSVKAGYDNNPNPTAADRIVGAKKGKKKMGMGGKKMMYQKGGNKKMMDKKDPNAPRFKDKNDPNKKNTGLKLPTELSKMNSRIKPMTDKDKQKVKKYTKSVKKKKKMMYGGKKKMMGGGMMKKYQSGGFLEPGIPNIDDL